MAETISLELDHSDWSSVTDGVMGGISSGAMLRGEETGHLRFTGELSLENNGGFASVRRRVDEDLSQAQQVLLQVRGDGRAYQFRVRQDSRFDGVAWKRSFSTSGQWQNIELPFSSFQAVYRGNRVAGAGPVAPGQIRQIGFMLADGQAGEFSLDIRSIVFGAGT